jgi:hypothetical protein
MKTITAIATVLMISVIAPASVVGDDEELSVYYDLVPDRYALIGQLPDGGAAYQGTAEITYLDSRLQLVKHIENKAITATGKVERADPGESYVLRFRWPEHEETCLVSVDLDNYGRLSCYWIVKGTDHKKPGLEAYFSTETWP